MSPEPVQVIPEQGRKVLQLIGQALDLLHLPGQLEQGLGRELASLQLPQNLAELLGKPGQPRAGAEQLQFMALSGQQSPQHHQPAFLIEHFGRRQAQALEDEMGQALERENMQPRVPWNARLGQKLPLQLVGRLLGGDEQQRPPLRARLKRATHLSQTTKRLPAPSRPE